jgi:hypothetical protein
MFSVCVCVCVRWKDILDREQELLPCGAQLWNIANPCRIKCEAPSPTVPSVAFELCIRYVGLNRFPLEKIVSSEVTSDASTPLSTECWDHITCSETGLCPVSQHILLPILQILKFISSVVRALLLLTSPAFSSVPFESCKSRNGTSRCIFSAISHE